MFGRCALSRIASSEIYEVLPFKSTDGPQAALAKVFSAERSSSFTNRKPRYQPTVNPVSFACSGGPRPLHRTAELE